MHSKGLKSTYGLGTSVQRQTPLSGRLESITDSKLRKPVEAGIHHQQRAKGEVLIPNSIRSGAE